jgi:hypothetical protein
MDQSENPTKAFHNPPLSADAILTEVAIALTSKTFSCRPATPGLSGLSPGESE